MALGPDTTVVNGTRFVLPTSDMFHPASYGQQTTGVPNVSPTIPPYIGAGGGGMGGGGAAVADPSMQENVDGYGTAGNNALVTQIAANHPHNLKVSPVWWVVGFMVVGVFLLRVVHFGTVVESSAHVGD